MSFNGYNCSFETKLVYKLISCFLPFWRAVFSLDACKDASGGGGGNPLFQPSSYTTKNYFLQVFTYSQDKKVSLQGQSNLVRSIKRLTVKAAIYELTLTTAYVLTAQHTADTLNTGANTRTLASSCLAHKKSRLIVHLCSTLFPAVRSKPTYLSAECESRRCFHRFLFFFCQLQHLLEQVCSLSQSLLLCTKTSGTSKLLTL